MEKRNVKSRRVARKEVSAMAWIENEAGSVLLVRQRRGSRLWALPGGKIESSESLADGLVREVREETNLDVGAFAIIEVFDRPERQNLTVLFRASAKPGQTPVPCGREVCELKYFDRLPQNATPSLRHFWRIHHAK